MTKDERFLVELYRRVPSKGETLDPYELGHELGYRDRLINNILNGLLQANLLKRYAPDEVTITDRGVEVAKTLSS